VWTPSRARQAAPVDRARANVDHARGVGVGNSAIPHICGIAERRIPAAQIRQPRADHRPLRFVQVAPSRTRRAAPVRRWKSKGITAPARPGTRRVALRAKKRVGARPVDAAALHHVALLT
jgi:hypothetical protein